MVIAVCSDIHGNIKNLEVFLNRLKRESVSSLLCCGDVVDFGGTFEDKACLETLSRLNSKISQGNHDANASNLRQYMLASKSQAQFDAMLRTIPNSIVQGEIMIVHSLPSQNKKIKNTNQAKIAFLHLQENYPEVRICFVGHHHFPVAFSYDPPSKLCFEERETIFQIKDNLRYIINPGSLGASQGDYLLFNQKERKIERRKLYG